MDVKQALHQLPLLRDLPADARARVEERASIVSRGAQEPVWARGDAAETFSFLISGQVHLRAAQHGANDLLIDVVDSPGSLLCVPAVCGAGPFCCEAVCARHTELLVVERDALLDGTLPPFAALLLQQAAQRGALLCRRLGEVNGNKVEQRVPAVLLRLADERGTPTPTGTKLPSTLSRRELAGLCGCATETLIRELARLEGLGVLTRQRRALFVDLDAMSELVYGPITRRTRRSPT